MPEETKNLNIIISIRKADYRFLASFNNGPNRVFRTPYEILEAIGVEIDQLSIQAILTSEKMKRGIYLTIREAKVLYLRAEFGEKKTLEQVAKIFKVTRERIRQIEIKAVKKLKYSLADKLLKDTMGKLEKEGIVKKEE